MSVPISNVTRRVVFAPSGTGPYAFTFEILSETDIEVYKGDTLLTLTTDYTVTINANGTGSVTLVLTAGTDNITIIGARAIQRATDFVTGGDFFANTVNTELDSLTIFAQQNAEGLARALTAPETDPTTINMTLPRAADRANKYLAFNASGDPEPGDTAVDVGVVAGIVNDIVVVSGIAANVTTVANNDANINTLSAISGNITTVAGISGNVTNVANNSSNITAVASDLSGTDTIGTVATDISNVNAVGNSIASVNTVAGEIGVTGEVTVVATDLAGTNTIGTVSTNITNVNSVGSNISNVNTTATNISNVNTVGGNLSGANTIGTVSGSISNVNTVAGSISSVNTVSTNISNVNTLAGINANVTTVAGISTAVSTVATNQADVTTVSTDLAGSDTIGTVATNITEVVAVGTNISNVLAVDANETNINDVAGEITPSNNISTVAGLATEIAALGPIAGDIVTVEASLTDISTVASDITDVVAVGSNIANVLAVDANETNINIVATDLNGSDTIGVVAGDITNVNLVGADIANVNSVAGELGAGQDVTVVAADLTGTDNIGTVAGDITNVNLVGGSIANVNIAATDIADINTLAGISGNVTSVANISSDVTTVSTNNANVTTVASSIASVNTNATNIANINQNAANIVAIQNASTNATNAAASASAASGSATDAAESAAAANAVSLGNEPVAPTIRPSLNLDFANVKALDPRITFTRTTTATYYGTETAKAEENLFLQSEDFLTTWTQLRLVRTANADTAPDGTATADSIVQAAGQTTAGNVAQTVTVAAGDYVASVFAKPNGKNYLVIRETLLDGTINDTYFDVQNGTVGTTGAGHTATITASTNSYYRCSIKFTANAPRSGSVNLYVADTDGSLTVADDGNGLYLWGAQLEQRSAVTDYTPTTTQPITNYIPVLETAASGVARFDHNPITGESLGLLVEEQRTNLLTRSEEFGNATWLKASSTVTANNNVAPDGTTTAGRIIPNSSTASHHIRTAATLTTTGLQYTFSIYAKADGYNFIQILATGGFADVNFWANFDLSNGTVGATGSATTASIEAVGNGWYRCRATGTAAGSGDPVFAVLNANTASRDPLYAGDDYAGVFLWGAQAENAAFPTSYIPTVAASVTRNADVASMTSSNFSSWFSNAEGTLYAEINPRALAVSSGIQVNDNSTSNRIRLATTSTSDQGTVTTSGTAQATLDGGTPVANTNMKLAMSYKFNDFALSLSGGTAATDTSGTVPVVNQLQIGAETTTVGNLNIKKIAYYPKALSDAEKQALTTI